MLHVIFFCNYVNWRSRTLFTSMIFIFILIFRTPATVSSKVKISTTAAPIKISADIEPSPSSGAEPKDVDSKLPTSASKTSLSPLPPSVLPASVTSLSAPPPPASEDKISAKSSIAPKLTPKIEVEGKLLPVLRSGIPQSIQLISSDCEIPSFADYFPHFPGNKFIKKPNPYLHNNLYNTGNGLYPNINIHGIKNFNNAPYYNHGFGGKESVNSFNIHPPPPPPPPPTPKNDVRETTTLSSASESDENEKKDLDTLSDKTKTNGSSIAEKSTSTLEINDELAPISIPPIKVDKKEIQKPIVVSTKLRPPPINPIVSSSNTLGNVKVSDSVAPESIPELGPEQEQKKVLHNPSITTTYYNVVNDNKDHPARPSYVSRPRPKIHFDDSDPSKIHQWNHLGKLPTQYNNQNGYFKYQLNVGHEGSKWPVKSTYFASPPSLLPLSAKRPIPNWPSVSQNNRHTPYQSYNPFSQGSFSHTSFNSYNPYSPTNLNANPQLPYQITQYHFKEPHLQSQKPSYFGDSETEGEENKIDFISENNITDETIKHTINSNSNTEATLMGKDSSMQRVTMHHLSSDEQLTILKVNPEDKDGANASTEHDSNNNTTLKLPNAELNISVNEITSNHVNESIGVPYPSNLMIEGNDTLSKIDEHHQNQTSKEAHVEKGDKVDYIVLHKLPNGEALDLENMKTYTMVDLKSKISDERNIDQGNISHAKVNENRNNSKLIRPLTYLAPPPRRSDMPRSIDFSINEKINSDKENIYGPNMPSISNKRNDMVSKNNEQKQEDIESQMHENGDDFADQIIKSYMSETPEDIDKLKAMMLESESSENQDENKNHRSKQSPASPVYIITEEDYMKHKNMLNQKEQVELKVDLENVKVNDKRNKDQIKVPKPKEDLELLPIPKKQISLTIVSPYNSNSTSTGEIVESETIQNEENNSTTDNSNIKRIDNNLEYHWTPMPEEETTSTSGPRVFGPHLPPEGYVPPEDVSSFSAPSQSPIDADEIDELSKLAYVTVNDNGDELVSNMKIAQETKENIEEDENDKNIENESSIEENKEDNINTEMNVQLLPQRLSAVLTHITQHLPQRPSISSNTPPPLNRGQAPSKQRSIGQFNSFSHNSAPPYGYHNHGLLRQNKIAPIFKEEERQTYQANHNFPSSNNFHDIPLGSYLENPISSQPTFPAKPQFHSLPQNTRAIPLSSSVEPRNYSPKNHGRQNNARRINYPKSVNNNQFPQPSPYQTQIVPGARDTLRYIPLHDATPPSKKLIPPHPPPLRWRTRHRGIYHGRTPQQKHRRPLKQFNAKMLQASPTYSSVEILRSHRRKVKPQAPITHKDLKKPFPIFRKEDDDKMIIEDPDEDKVSDTFLERKLQTNEKNITVLTKDMNIDKKSDESSTDIAVTEGTDSSTTLEDNVTTTLSSVIEID